MYIELLILLRLGVKASALYFSVAELLCCMNVIHFIVTY